MIIIKNKNQIARHMSNYQFSITHSGAGSKWLRVYICVTEDLEFINNEPILL